MKDTALTSIHFGLGARMTPFAGYNMPLEYSGVIKEHMAVRESAGIFDVSHMGEFWVKGSGALPFLQRICSNDISVLGTGQAQYNVLPNGKGGIVDDLIVYRYDTEKYLAVVNASNIDKDWSWFNENNSFGAELQNASEEISLIAIQGPKAKAILQNLTEFDLDSIKSFHFETLILPGTKEVIVSNTGYTGAGGFELYCYNEDAVNIWNELMKIGEPLGLVPAGLASRDTLRLEMGYCLYGNDIDDSTSPIEAGLGWVVKFKDGNDFIDWPLLKEQKENGVSKKLVGIEMVERGIPRHGYKLLSEDGNEIGEVTSGTMSPILQKGIGMAYVMSGYTSVGENIYVEVRNKKIKAMVVKLPFI